MLEVMSDLGHAVAVSAGGGNDADAMVAALTAVLTAVLTAAVTAVVCVARSGTREGQGLVQTPP